MWEGLLTSRINNKLEKSNLINEHALNREPAPLSFPWIGCQFSFVSSLKIIRRRDRSFSYEVGGADGIWGGGGWHAKKKGLKGGPPKKTEGRGGSRKIFKFM